ncbi:serine hydrolase domain-containing protein [Fulvivirga lutea]|uniref:Beta-lactamase family protein n=1 Tax=Fulvivirga lutea TaxID=2810512 RepID=A0A975A1N3_9BACT|nr:serine hydrolase domain-containing protein [Fulvivirga lutea]QSE98511.1 beta-lactamase family protein [Fulvivirga lutea]
MKKYVVYFTIAELCLASYFLFEPAAAYNWGWNTLPNTFKHASVEALDSSYFDAIKFSKSEVDIFSAMGIPALSVAVGVGDNIVWSEVRGYADIDQEIAANTQTSFRIGSVSKAVTSVALAKLMDAGALNIEDKVTKYLPDYKYNNVTIKQLASHTSGIRNYDVCLCIPIFEYYSNDAYASVDESLELFVQDPLLFEPGTDFSYSSYNFTLLSAVLEKAADVSFYELMKNEVFEPLEMHQTTFDFNDSIFTNRAEFYEVREGEYKKSFEVDNSNKWAGGGIISTPTDLVKMGLSLLNEGFISRETFEIITTPIALNNGEINEQNYALGWRKSEFEFDDIPDKVTVIHHGGTAVGSTALLLLVPDYQLTVAIIMNRSVQDFPLFDLAKPIIGAFVNQIK